MVKTGNLGRLRRQTLVQCDTSITEEKDSVQLLNRIPNLHKFVSGHETFPYCVYSTTDPTGRPYQVWRHDHDGYSDTKLFEERNTSCSIDVAMTRDREYITINSNSRTSSEVHIMRSHDLLRDPELVKKRQPLVEYYMEHAHNRFYILTNAGQDREYELMVADGADPRKWKPLYKPKDGLVLHDIEVFSNQVILYGTRKMIPIITVIDPKGTDLVFELSDVDSYWIEKPTSHIGFRSKTVPVWLSSPVLPPHRILIGKQESFQHIRPKAREGYKIERTEAISKDGTSAVPITLCYGEDKLNKDNSNPLLVHVYGCYGENLPLGYKPEHEQLVSMGWILAFCHVRGGGDKGRRWYHEGQGRKKMNSFQDLHGCVEHLQSRLKLSRPNRTAMTGRSAGGQTVGMFCNMWPELIQAAILQVPFVDVKETLMDSSLYSSLMDYEEFDLKPWIGENNSEDFLTTICPYSTLKPQDYPSFYITASKSDDIISYEGIQKYANRLKQCVKLYRSRTKLDVTQKMRGTVLLRELKSQGHYESQDITKQCYEAALYITFLHKTLNLPLQL